MRSLRFPVIQEQFVQNRKDCKYHIIFLSYQNISILEQYLCKSFSKESFKMLFVVYYFQCDFHTK